MSSCIGLGTWTLRHTTSQKPAQAGRGCTVHYPKVHSGWFSVIITDTKCPYHSSAAQAGPCKTDVECDWSTGWVGAPHHANPENRKVTVSL